MAQPVNSMWRSIRKCAHEIGLPAVLGLGLAATPVASSFAQAKSLIQLVWGNQNNNGNRWNGGGGWNGGNWNGGGWNGGGWNRHGYNNYIRPPVIVVIPQIQPQPWSYCDTGQQTQILGYDGWGRAITDPQIQPQYRVNSGGEIFAPCN